MIKEKHDTEEPGDGLLEIRWSWETSDKVTFEQRCKGRKDKKSGQGKTF